VDASKERIILFNFFKIKYENGYFPKTSTKEMNVKLHFF